MRGKTMPGTLPMLPGNVYADPTVTRYHKTQLLGVRDGAICGKLKQIYNHSGLPFKCNWSPFFLQSRYRLF